MTRSVLSILLLLLSAMAPSAMAQSLSDGITFKTWGDYKSLFGAESGDCHMLPAPLSYKIHGGLNGEAPLTDAEFVELVGDDHQLFGVLGGTRFYVRSAGELMELMPAYLTLQGIDMRDQTLISDQKRFMEMQTLAQGFTPDKIPADTPVLCGSGEVEKQMRERELVRLEEQRAAKAEYERTCKACTLPGGPYLQAIYDGDYAEQHRIGQIYMGRMLMAGGTETMAAGVIINSLQGIHDLTLLEDIIGYYMLASTRKWGDQCFAPDAASIRFTTTYPDQVYETLDGIEIGRDPGFTAITDYRVNPKFLPACDVLCNKNGGILLGAKMASGFGQEIAAVRVFRGTDEFLETYACDSPEIRQFEDNLLSMWDQERAQPDGTPRNSMAEVFRQ